MPFHEAMRVAQMYDSQSQRELVAGLEMWTEVGGLALLTGPTGVGKSISLRPTVISDDACRKLFQASPGRPRQLSQLVLDALITAAANGRDTIDGRFIQQTMTAHPLFRRTDSRAGLVTHHSRPKAHPTRIISPKSNAMDSTTATTPRVIRRIDARVEPELPSGSTPVSTR